MTTTRTTPAVNNNPYRNVDVSQGAVERLAHEADLSRDAADELSRVIYGTNPPTGLALAQRGALMHAHRDNQSKCCAALDAIRIARHEVA